MGPLAPCSYCRKRSESKLAQLTWAWNLADGSRVAWRQRLCIACYATNVLGLDRDTNPEDTLTCPACGVDTEHDYDAVYATAFVPGLGKTRLELPLCAPCAVEVRNRAMLNAERLENRDPVSRGQAPGSGDTSSPWDKLGITPRD